MKTVRFTKRSALRLLVGAAILMGGVVPSVWAADTVDTQRPYAKLMDEKDVTISNYQNPDPYNNGSKAGVRNRRDRLFFYNHDADGNAVGGHITIQKASLQSSGDKAQITLATDSDGLNLSSDASVNKTLSSLADKLTYAAYVNGERNLEGTAEIYEGVTFSSASKKVSALQFDDATGQASITGKVITPFNTILGEDDASSDYTTRGATTDRHIYNFTEDTIIQPNLDISKDKDWHRDYAAIQPEGPDRQVVMNMNGHDLTVIMHGNIYNGGSWTTRAVGIYPSGGGTVEINNPGTIRVDTDSNYYYYGDISIGGGNSTVDIHNDLEHPVIMRVMESLDGYAMNMTAMKTFGGRITIDGPVDIYTKGAWAKNASSGTINLSGGKIVTDNYEASVTGYNGATMNVNVRGHYVDNDLTPLNNKLNIKGNVATMGIYVHTDDNGEINIALPTSDSSLEGRVIENNPDDDVAATGTRLWLTNGAKWINTGKSSLRQLYGGKDAASTGYIDMSKSGGADLHLARLSGHTTVFYDQKNGSIEAGSVRLGHAYKDEQGNNASLTIMTDNDGISAENLNDKTYVENLLNRLAAKLVYTAYAEGENNLDGYVAIGEGLTDSGATIEKIQFNKRGAGYVEGFQQTKTGFTTTLTGDVDTDTEYDDANVLKSAYAPVFSDDSTINVADKAGIHVDGDKAMTVEMNNYGLTIQGNNGSNSIGADMAGTMTVNNAGVFAIKDVKTGISAVKTDAQEAGAHVSITGDSPNVSITASDTGIHVSGKGRAMKKSWKGLTMEDDPSDVIITSSKNGSVSITNADKENASFVGVKVEDHGQVTLDKPVIDAGKGGYPNLVVGFKVFPR